MRKKHGLNRFAQVQCGEPLAIPEKCQLGSGRVDLGGLRLANPALFKNVGSSGSGNSKKARKGSTDSKKEKKKPGRPAGSTNKVSQETKKKKPEAKAQSKETIR